MLIHLGWTGSSPPSSVIQAVNAARMAAPSCDVMFHSDESAVPPAWRDAMDRLRLPAHMRSDVQRHCILRKHGGLWLDADVRVMADPVAWTAGWDRYTAIRLGDVGGFVGTDIIYLPPGWAGWAFIDGYINSFLNDPPQRYSVLHVASTMIERMARKNSDLFSILTPGDRFPFDRRRFTAASVVARGFDPPTSPPAAMPSLIQRAATFTKAAARHVAAGMPRATDEEVEWRFAVCQQCEHFDGKACRKCGCGISRERRFASKLSWAGERCPVGKW